MAVQATTSKGSAKSSNVSCNSVTAEKCETDLVGVRKGGTFFLHGNKVVFDSGSGRNLHGDFVSCDRS